MTQKTNKPLKPATMLQRLNPLQDFFVWLSQQTGYRRVITTEKYEQFNLNKLERARAKVHDMRDVPTLKDVETLLRAMPTDNDMQIRDRALVAFLVISGIRLRAVIGLKLKHVCLPRREIRQDPREVWTKFGRSLTTQFFPVSEQAEKIFCDYVKHLRSEKNFGPDDPLFPRSKRIRKTRFQFGYDGISPEHYKSGNTIQKTVKAAFEAQGYPGFSPHSFRHMLGALGNRQCGTFEQQKAWSQNLAHKNMATTQNHYARLDENTKAEVLENMRTLE